MDQRQQDRQRIGILDLSNRIGLIRQNTRQTTDQDAQSWDVLH